MEKEKGWEWFRLGATCTPSVPMGVYPSGSRCVGGSCAYSYEGQGTAGLGALGADGGGCAVGLKEGVPHDKWWDSRKATDLFSLAAFDV